VGLRDLAAMQAITRYPGFFTTKGTQYAKRQKPSEA
jgi:hypothetical protein